MNLCAELYNHKKQISIDKLYTIPRKVLHLEHLTIEIAIDRLIEKKYIVPNSFIFKNSILENETRQKIYNHILTYGAVSAHEIKNALNLGNNIIAWNLKKMLEFGLIKEIQFKKKRIYSSKEFSTKKQ